MTLLVLLSFLYAQLLLDPEVLGIEFDTDEAFFRAVRKNLAADNLLYCLGQLEVVVNVTT